MPRIDPEKQKLYQRAHYKRKTEYYKEKAHERKLKLLEWYREYKSTLKCTKCPEDHPACLDFHHLDPKEKDRNIIQMVRAGVSLEKILKEIAKCIVICSNCHRKIHAAERELV